jgi:hypothetical protein
MAGKNNSRRWILLALVAVGVVVAATLPRSGSEEAEDTPSTSAEMDEPSTTSKPTSASDTDGGKASRRVAEGCDSTSEALRYEEFIGRRALAILSWDGLSEDAANLKVPVSVVGIEGGTIGVRFMQFPMRDQYVGIWIGSGHIEHGHDDVFLLEPCSATIVEWTELERGRSTDAAE